MPSLSSASPGCVPTNSRSRRPRCSFCSAREPAAVPDPFAQLIRDHVASRPNLRTANTNGSPWLFPGYRAGRHLNAQSVMLRLRATGIDLLGARNAALRDLVRQLPAPIVATQLGYSHQVTQRPAELAAGAMSKYATVKRAGR
jgi:hypothetical protein